MKGNKRTDHLENSGAEALQSDKFLFFFFFCFIYNSHGAEEGSNRHTHTKKLINLDLSLTLSTKNSKWIITINVKYKFFRMKT